MISIKAKKKLESLKFDWDFHNCINCDICPDCGGEMSVFTDESMGHGYPRICKDCDHTFWKSNSGFHSRHTPVLKMENLCDTCKTNCLDRL